MNWLIALQLLPLLTNLIKIAEGLLDSGTGVEKKAFVVDAVTQIIETMVEMSTGGQKKTWEALEGALGAIKGLIDVLVGLFFPHED